MIKIEAPNLMNIIGQLKALVTRIPISTKQSAKMLAEELLIDSQTKPPMCPVDTGRLLSSGRVEAVNEGYAVIYGGDSYDGTFVDYAGYVHDDLRPRHYQRPGSGPKFVETHSYAMAERAPEKISQILQELADEIITEGR